MPEQPTKNGVWFWLVVASLATIVWTNNRGCDQTPKPPVVETKVERVAYVFDVAVTPAPAEIRSAFRDLNDTHKIPAELIDVTGNIPADYQKALTHGKASGLPCLVVCLTDGTCEVKEWTTKADVLKAAGVTP